MFLISICGEGLQPGLPVTPKYKPDALTRRRYFLIHDMIELAEDVPKSACNECIDRLKGSPVPESKIR